MITSVNNQQIKNVLSLKNKSKARREQRCFLVEGIRMFMEIPSNSLVKAYFSESFYKQLESQGEKAESVLSKAGEYELVDDKVFGTMSDTVTPQGILAIVRQQEWTVESFQVTDYSASHHCFMILEDIQDPGNLGTIIRTAEGAGVSGVVMSRNTADIYNPKVVRSTMGSIFRVPFLYTDNIEKMVSQMKEQDIRIYAAHLKGSCDYDAPDYTKPSAFMIGNEGNGLSDTLTGYADCLIRIPMCGKVESLNAANAATVLMYESYRQNRNV